MSNSTKEKLPIDWRSVVAGAVLGSLITVGAFIIPLALANNSWPRWADWTGFGENETISREQRVDGSKPEIVNGGKKTLTKITTQIRSGKGLWDWLDLLLVPVLLALLGYVFQRREQQRAEQQARDEKKRTEQQANLERETAATNLRDQALQAYIDRMADLLLNQELRKELLPQESSESSQNANLKESLAGSYNHVRDIARIRTVTILRSLEGDIERQARVLDFLRDAELLGFLLKRANLQGVSLKEANLEGAILEGAILERANLRKASFRGIAPDDDQEGAYSPHLERANLREATLQEATLEYTNLKYANLEKANLQKANLFYAVLTQARMMESIVQNAVLQSAGLSGADLKKANLGEANLALLCHFPE